MCNEEEPQGNIDALILVIAHAGLLILAALLFVFIVPAFGEMFADFGEKLPAPTQVVLNLSLFCGRYGLFLALIVPLILAGDVGAHHVLLKEGGKVMASIWLWFFLILLIALNTFIVLSMFSPQLFITSVMGGP